MPMFIILTGGASVPASRISTAKFHSPQFYEQCNSEMPQINHITFEQSARLLQQTKNPFESTAAHPHWRALDVAGEKINRRANTNHHRHAERTIIGAHPFLG